MKTYRFPLTKSDQSDIRKTLLESKGTIVYPTETFYALGCAADQSQAVSRIYEIKQRDRKLPLLVLINHWEMLNRFVNHVHAPHLQLLRKHWPGPLTAILDQNGNLANELNYNGRSLGFRMTSSPIAQDLISIIGTPLVGTSANRSLEKEADTVDSALNAFGDLVDIYIDGGKTPGIKPSTLVDMTKERYAVVREGMISI